MTRSIFLLPLVLAFLLGLFISTPAPSCCPAGPSGKPVANADQAVIIIWDAAAKIQHFIRRASFKSEANDFGFLVPTPSQPELEESGNEAFPYLQKLTEPEIITMPRPSGGMGCGCGRTRSESKALPLKSEPPAVKVLEEKVVAGFNAAVLEARSAAALVGWLKDHGYAYSKEIETWAKPYVDLGWKITALKVAKDKDRTSSKSVAASALRMSFKTDRPVFPYREPDFRSVTELLGLRSRLLRIYFVGDARYQGELTKDMPWTGKVAWANKLKEEDRKKTLELLKLPANTGPAAWWLTEFEDQWPYRVHPADVYFSASAQQDTIKRLPIIEYVSSPWPTDFTLYAFAALVIVPRVLRQFRKPQ